MPLHCQGSGERGCWGHSGLALPPRPLCCISPVLLFPLLMTLTLFPLRPRQRWAVPWGPGGRGAGAAPRAGLAAGPAAARSLSRPGTEAIPVPTSSSAAAAWGSTRPAGRPKVTRAAAALPPAPPRVPPSRGVFNHPRAPHGCSSARGGQDPPQLLQPGLQRSLAKSWAAAAGGALGVRVDWAPLYRPSPEPGPLLSPLRARPLCAPQTQSLFVSPPLLFSLPQTAAPLHAHTQPWPFAAPQNHHPSHSPIQDPSAPPQSHYPPHLPNRGPSATPQTHIPFIPKSIKKPTTTSALPTTFFPLFSSRFAPSPARPSPATAAISAWRRWAPRAAGSPGAAGCSGTGGCVCSAGGTGPTAGPTAPGTACKEPGRCSSVPSPRWDLS